MMLQQCWSSATCNLNPHPMSSFYKISLGYNPPNCISHISKSRRASFNCILKVGFQDIAAIADNKVLIAAGLSAAIGQLSKPFTSSIFYHKGFDFRVSLQAGGFPSTHSSAVVAAATSLALERGFSDSIFGLTVIYAGIVMYDAQGVRKEVGNHARALNRFFPKMNVDSDDQFDSCENQSDLNIDRSRPNSTDTPVLLEIKKNITILGDGNPTPLKLKESIGHTEVEVMAGAFLGFLVSLAVHAIP